jgi:hypothetical protein
MKRLTSIRIAAALLPATLLLHEAVYLAAGSPDTGSHGYLETFLPVIAVGGVSLLVAALLLPSLQGGGDQSVAVVALRPVSIAFALILLFSVQELAEIALLGGGISQLATVLGASWLLLPLALLCGTLGTALVDTLERLGEEIARFVTRRSKPMRSRRTPRGRCAPPLAEARCISPLAFGLARRPPPVPA